jgi:hypothetical protein
MRPSAPKEAVNCGGRTWARTKDPLIKSQLLYQLSYASNYAKRGEKTVVDALGLEPRTR